MVKSLRIGFLLVLLLQSGINHAKTVIKGCFLTDRGTLTVYWPHKKFANFHIGTPFDLGSGKDFEIAFDLDQPTFVKLIVSGKQLILWCKPNAVIRLTIDPNSHFNWVSIENENAAGELYFNLIYNADQLSKFSGMRSIFEGLRYAETEELSRRIQRELVRQTGWVDSLLEQRKISREYAEYSKLQIGMFLGWEVGNLCDKYFKGEPESEEIGRRIKQDFFRLVDPLDPRATGCLSAAQYYYTYFHTIYSEAATASVAISCPDCAHYSAAPKDLQGFLWGHCIWANYLFAPEKYDYCKLAKEYQGEFSDGAFLPIFSEAGLCKKKESSQEISASFSDDDLFAMIRTHFRGRRVLIDLWATWCGPCKAEFRFYDKSLLTFLQDLKIELAFLSIDKPEHRERWEKDIRAMTFGGQHILAGKKLQESIQEILFDGGPIEIPRYVLVDEAGKIVTTNFLRPSQPDFKSEIERAFGTKK